MSATHAANTPDACDEDYAGASAREKRLISACELRVVAVHAHPDDEAIWTGGLLATLSAAGSAVTVVTCTLGEEGEVIGDTFAQLVSDQADQLGGFRIGELSESLRHLGATGCFLGGAGRWRDSGMAGTLAAENPRAFVRAGDTPVDELVAVLRARRPHVVVTYGPDGGYGHPDHVRAHEITHAAVERMDADYRQGRSAIAPPRRILWAVTDRDTVDRGVNAITVVPSGWRLPAPGEIAAVDHADVCLQLHDRAWAAKCAAMKAHATQLWIADGSVSATNPVAARAAVSDPQQVPAVFALSNLIAQPLSPVEHYTVGWGEPLAPGAQCPLEGIVETPHNPGAPSDTTSPGT